MYISLGCYCYPRVYMKEKLNLTYKNNYKSCPFDLCVTPYTSLYDCLKTDFKYFFDDLHLAVGCNAPGNRTLCGEGGKDIKNYYGMIFNHEGSTHSHLFNEGKNDDEFYIRNDFYEFKKRYKRRINNFLEYIDKHDNIIFVHKTHPDVHDNGNIQNICDMFSHKYPNKIFNFIEL
jgi:hypothetical protein